ncbi:MAG: dicarboxylate/amino acid:cation symporter [Acidobacteria bacterium]|nr:dicarboxylate/amino acid:cation symporter [Acidobacteriota bacterium]MDW7984022.1 dicarboxylate/amino acid:cation symporter [Acidobacteriota bacterium]
MHHRRVFIGFLIGTISGLTAHLAWPDSSTLAWLVDRVAEPIGRIFLRMLLMIVIPLVFSALVLGVAGFRDLRRLGRIGLKTLMYTVTVSATAVLIGLTLANTVRPGLRLSPEHRQALVEQVRAGTTFSVPPRTTGVESIVRIVPDNPLRAMAENDMLAVMFFALVFGIALSMTSAAKTQPVVDFLEGAFEIAMRMVDLAMRLAPVGVAALLFTATARLGFSILGSLGLYVLIVLAGLALHQFGTYSLALGLLARTHPVRFFRQVREVMLTAFSTSSSNATLPTALRVAENELHLRPEVARFVLTLGATANQNGTALYEGVTVLFLSQLFLGHSLAWNDQLTVLFLAILGGIGTAGVPAGSLPFVAMVLATVGVPPEGIGIILGIDRILDMCRTVLNVTGDMVAAVVIDATEKPPAVTL